MKHIIFMVLCGTLAGCNGITKSDLGLKDTPTVNKSGQVAVLDETYNPETLKKPPAESKTDAFIKAASSMVYVPQLPNEEKSTKPVTEAEAIKIDSAPRAQVNQEALPGQEIPVLSNKTAIKEIPPPSLPIRVKPKVEAVTETQAIDVKTVKPIIETGMAPEKPKTVIVETGVSKFFSK